MSYPAGCQVGPTKIFHNSNVQYSDLHYIRIAPVLVLPKQKLSWSLFSTLVFQSALENSFCSNGRSVMRLTPGWNSPSLKLCCLILSLIFYNQNVYSQISNRGRYSISNIKQELTICQQMLKIWCIHLSFFEMCKKFVHLNYILCFSFGRLKLARGAIYLY